MNIALIGYGKMGQAIEKIALQRGHKISAIIDLASPGNFDSEGFKNSDVAIEFTTPDSAYQNYTRCFTHHIPIVSGTTGWLDHLNEIKTQCESGAQTFFYASNFSLGVNLFLALNNHLAKLMNGLKEYEVEMTETHHIHKLDAPSGTAITLAEGILSNLDRKTKWVLAPENAPEAIEITSIREGEVPGTHTIRYRSDVDEITLTHEAKSRQGFALGAVLAAEFVRDKKGFLGMHDLLNF